MKSIVAALLVALLPVLALAADPAVAADAPDWAYPATPKPEPQDNVVLKRMPGSTKEYTQAQINDPFHAPDWYPDEHPAMPDIVAHGAKPAVQACARCHLPSGAGHPESSALAGLPVPYLIRQMANFKSGARKGGRAGNMITFAAAISDADVRAAGEYFASLKPGAWTRVIEADVVPKSFVGEGAMRFAVADGGSEPIGSRIIELPQDEMRAKSRDAHSGFIAYVPAGSVARGEALVTTGDSGKTIACAICHGPALTGFAELPGIAGRSPLYVFRQLNDMQTGQRAGGQTDLMKLVVANLTADDMLAIAAYLATREP
jgi:cytochrome c553